MTVVGCLVGNGQVFQVGSFPIVITFPETRDSRLSPSCISAVKHSVLVTEEFGHTVVIRIVSFAGCGRVNTIIIEM